MVIQIDIMGRGQKPPWLLYVPGGLLILLGLMIIVMPQILQFLVGGLCIAIGMAFVAVPMRMRR